ncbi:MAG: phosphotransferase [Caldilineaceae bacterium]|nr:phosphotransferase [Caldilineaceae bacterium]
MVHQLYDSVDELLTPETLTALTGRKIKYVRCLPMEGGFSGNSLLRIEADSAQGVSRFVLKRMAFQRDWLMLASNDKLCRSITLWHSGLLDRLPPTLSHTIVACAHDDGDWAMLMDDVSPTLLPNRPYTTAEVYLLLDALATIHATFWAAEELTDPALGLCTHRQVLEVFTQATGRRFATLCPVSDALEQGWSLLQELMAPDVIDVLDKLYADPQPLCDALARYPTALIHGDYRGPNLGINWSSPAQVVLFDWQLAAHSAATIDLAWFFAGHNVFLAPVALEALTDYYRHRLREKLGARFDDAWWQPLLSLGQLTNVLRRACLKAWAANNHADPVYRATERKLLEIYSDQVRAAVQWL